MKNLFESKEAPHGAMVVFKGMKYKKGFTDQPTWMPLKKTGGFEVVIPAEDEENYDAIEKEWLKQSSNKSGISPDDIRWRGKHTSGGNPAKIKGTDATRIRSLLSLGYKLDAQGNAIADPDGKPIGRGIHQGDRDKEILDKASSDEKVKLNKMDMKILKAPINDKERLIKQKTAYMDKLRAKYRHNPMGESSIPPIKDIVDYNNIERDIKKYREALIGVQMSGKKDPGYAMRIKQLEAALKDYDRQQATQLSGRKGGAGAYQDLTYKPDYAASYFSKELKDGAREYYNAVLKKVVDALEARKRVRLFLQDVSSNYGVIWADLDGKEMQLTKKKMRLKDINGILNGDFNTSISESIISEGAFLNSLKPADNVDRLWSALNSELTIFDEKQSSKPRYNQYALGQYLEAVQGAKRMAGSNPSKMDVFKALRKYFEMRHTSRGPFFELYPVQACAEKYGVDYDSVKPSKPESKTYTAMGSSFLEARDIAGSILCGDSKILSGGLSEGFNDDGYHFEGDNVGLNAWDVSRWFFEIDLYDNLQNIGKRGKTVGQTAWTITHPETRTAWPATLISRLKPGMGKAQVVAEINKLIKELGDEVGADKVKANSHEYTLKGIDKHIPDPSWVAKFIDKAGKDVAVHFKKPHITISSKKDSDEAEKSRMYNYISIEWFYAKKVNRVIEELIKGVGLSSASKILLRDKIKYDWIHRMDPQFESKDYRRESEMSDAEWRKALSGNRAMLAKMEANLKRLKNGDKVPNLSVQGAERAIQGLKAAIKNIEAGLGESYGYGSKTYSQLEYIAKKAHDAGADFPTKTVIQGISLAYDRAPTSAFNKLSLLKQTQAQSIFDDLVSQVKARKLNSMGEVARYLISLANEGRLGESSDIIVKDGKKIFSPQKPVYHKMPVSEFADMTERELQHLVHKAIPGTTVHYNLSDLFTPEQLAALSDSEAYKHFTRMTKDEVMNAMMGESRVQKPRRKYEDRWDILSLLKKKII